MLLPHRDTILVSSVMWLTNVSSPVTKYCRICSPWLACVKCTQGSPIQQALWRKTCTHFSVIQFVMDNVICTTQEWLALGQSWPTSCVCLFWYWHMHDILSYRTCLYALVAAGCQYLSCHYWKHYTISAPVFTLICALCTFIARW
jgi:hypothetical protein